MNKTLFLKILISGQKCALYSGKRKLYFFMISTYYILSHCALLYFNADIFLIGKSF